MKQDFRLEMATKKAEAFLRTEGITSLPVDPFVIAATRDIVVKPKPDTADGVSGMLLRHGNTFGILYATYVRNEGFQRFSISHELGHYFLEGHIDHVLPQDGVHSSHAGFVSADPYELEADSFAELPNGKCHRGKALDDAVIDPHMQKATIHVDGLFGAVPLETCRPVLKRSEQRN